jgi:hypothetical protein
MAVRKVPLIDSLVELIDATFLSFSWEMKVGL